MKHQRKHLMRLFAAAAVFSMSLSAGCGRQKPETAGRETDPLPVLEALEGEKPQEAKRLAVSCCVRLDVAGEEAEYYGSGVVWDQKDGRLIIATAGHLLKEGEVLRVVFYDGTAAQGRSLGVSDTLDVGFVEADWQGAVTGSDRTGNEDGLTPALVSLHQRRFDTLDGCSPLFVAAGTQDGCADMILDASLLEKAWYREEFGSDVMILSCDTQAGASGAGVFDGCGNFVGLVLGGAEGKTAVLSMEQVNQAYDEVCGSRRVTDDYP